LRYLLALGFCIVGIVLLQTRGTWIVTALVFVLALIRYIRNPQLTKTAIRLTYVLLSVLLLASVFQLTLPIPADVVARLRSIFEGSQHFDYRFINWETSLRVFLANPLGTGLGTWRFYAYEFDPLASYILSRYGTMYIDVLSPHSDWFSLLSEVGMVGVILYAWFWFRIAKVVFLGKAKSLHGVVLWCSLLAGFIGTFGGDYLLVGGGLSLPLYLYLYLMSEGMTTERVSFKLSVSRGPSNTPAGDRLPGMLVT
jgi:hypothetical protein